MAVPEDTGYPVKWFKNQDLVRNIYECVICLEVVKDPVQVRNCGHQFCRYCLKGILRNKPGHCPSCRQEINDELIFDDNAASRAIERLEVNCPNEGCEWDGCLASLLKEHTKGCLFFNLDCCYEGCTQQVMRKDFLQHFVECQHRLVVCRYCDDRHVFKDEYKHHEICEKFPVECKNQCSEMSIPRDEMDEHVVKDCPNTLVECEYLEFGCQYKCKRFEMGEHHKQEMKDHLKLSRLEISRLKAKHEKDIQKLKREINTGKVQRTGSFVMKITNFKRRLSEAKDNDRCVDIQGEPFFTSPLGYKMKMYVELNEKSEQHKNHMGVYIVLIKSDHDAILTWPFKKKCSFTLIDQQDTEWYRKNIVQSLTPKGQGQFKRPLNEENAGYGYPCFVSHATLQTRKYIMDDTVFITLQVES